MPLFPRFTSCEFTFPWQLRSNLNVGKCQNSYIPSIVDKETEKKIMIAHFIPDMKDTINKKDHRDPLVGTLEESNT